MAEKSDVPVDEVLYVLRIEDCYRYKLPGFPVLTVTLQRARVQKVDRDGNAELLDCLLNEEIASELHPPVAVEVLDSCTIEADKFLAQFPMSQMSLVDDCILVVWKSLCKESDKTTTAQNSSDDEVLGEESSAEDSDCDGTQDATALPDISHTVVFKCIGASRDSQSQIVLRAARDVIADGGTVAVRMRPEPTDIVDSRAIVFECRMEEKWTRIGYVVTEILDHVHAAISSNSIISVNFRCIRYVTHWSGSGPGNYAGISVTKNGLWDRLVKRYQSTIR